MIKDWIKPSDDIQHDINYEINKQINKILHKLLELQDRIERLENE